jgi:hypothetical protein
MILTLRQNKKMESMYLYATVKQVRQWQHELNEKKLLKPIKNLTDKKDNCTCEEEKISTLKFR